MPASRSRRCFRTCAGRDLPTLSKIGDHDLGALDAVFGCLPHGTTQDVIRELPRGPKVIDLSADFRLRDPEPYERTYGQPHRAIERQQDAVYGLTEHARDAIRATDLVANPGCYPTTAQLPLRPLLKARLIDAGRRSSSTPSPASPAPAAPPRRARCSPR